MKFIPTLAALLASTVAYASDADLEIIDKGTTRIQQITQTYSLTVEPMRTKVVTEMLVTTARVLEASARVCQEMRAEVNKQKATADDAEGRARKWGTKYVEVMNENERLHQQTLDAVKYAKSLLDKIDADQQRMLAVDKMETEIKTWKALYEAERLKNAKAELDKKVAEQKP
ncbi:MAG: hypothetical protein P4L99_21770 [Chthoniobacter sp.]|nr:hypothetical protein [Chthoniobacter sp.]